MMPVDVSTQIEIASPLDRVAAYSSDPENAPLWYVNIKAVEWKSTPPLQIGSKVAFIAEFLGRRLTYTYDVREFVPGERLVMRTAEGPFPMETTYTWQSTGKASSRMTLRNRGEPRGFSKLAAPFIVWAMRRENRKDLLRLKRILESRA